MSDRPDTTEQVRVNVGRVRERVARAAARSGRAANAVRIIAASKTKPPELITAAIRAGIEDIGENYVQEAAGKIGAVAAPARWHLIGHLQRNKAGRAVELFDVVQTVDSAALAEALDRRAGQRGHPLQVLVEVNVGGESSKNGAAPEQVGELVAALAGKPHLQVIGLMTVPPPVSAPDQARPYFAALRGLRDQLVRTVPGVVELSMGMTDDFEVAIEEGATMVRIGRAIFGAREG